MLGDKLAVRLITAVSIIVFLVILVLQSKLVTIFPVNSSIPDWVFVLPKLNASINATCTILLIISFFQIKAGRIEIHKTLNITTFILSSLFLISYIIFHSTGIVTRYGGTGGMKYFYYFILITHIILAALVLPLVLLSFYSGLKMNVVRHKKLVRWSFPIWLYVTVTGVLVYLMISPYYKF